MNSAKLRHFLNGVFEARIVSKTQLERRPLLKMPHRLPCRLLAQKFCLRFACTGIPIYFLLLVK
ncbi:hypothetical protein [Pleurocapsa sp. CCALA 161]|uniref:hypothetical protein n=1 Tax=Pleurocapsa sp. CCALA 161 TaxID=2107688 RepID=UPI0011B27DC7|nr:hypothetical protein [Pleurocapsa sp. CCALA 161]